MWSVDGKTKDGILHVCLEGSVSEDEMKAFAAAHNEAIDAFEGRDYRVFCDIRTLHPLSPEATTVFEQAKSYSAKQKNFRGSAVLVLGKLVAMQHQRTSVASGVMNTELISEDEAACWAHLAQVAR